MAALEMNMAQQVFGRYIFDGVEVRIETFNVLNRVNFAPSRQIQLGVRLLF